MSLGLETGLLEQDVPAGRDGSLGELELADVALGQVDRASDIANLAKPVQDEDPLLAELGQPRSDARRDPNGLLVGDKPPRGVDELQSDQLGYGVHEAGAAETLRFGVADDTELESVGGHPHDLDRAPGGAHAAADRRALERRTGRGGRRKQPIAVAEHDLAVGADVEEQPDPRVTVHPATRADRR